MKIDLHMHSYYSDGNFSPAEVVQKCKNRSLEVISLTDHENIDGIPEAKEAAEKLGIRLIPGTEFAVDFHGEEHHLLGYFIDYQSWKLKEFLEIWRKTKIIQIEKMIKNLRQLGFEVCLEDVITQARGSLDRYHISLAMFPDFAKSVEEKEKQRAFFRKFLLEKSIGGEGLAFAEREKPDVRAVIGLVHSIGGMAFWAHPFWKNKEASAIEGLALSFRGMGLDGIEAVYSHHNQEQTIFLHKIAQGLSMKESAGSDFHREDGSIRQIANFQTFGIELNFPFKD